MVRGCQVQPCLQAAECFFTSDIEASGGIFRRNANPPPPKGHAFNFCAGFVLSLLAPGRYKVEVTTLSTGLCVSPSASLRWEAPTPTPARDGATPRQLRSAITVPDYTFPLSPCKERRRKLACRASQD